MKDKKKVTRQSKKEMKQRKKALERRKLYQLRLQRKEKEANENRVVLKYKIKKSPKKRAHIKNKNRAPARRSSKYRKVRVFTLYAIAIVAIVSALLLFCSNFIFDINDIQVKGNEHYSAEEIIAQTDAYGKNLLFLNTNEITQKIKDNLPYICDLNITKKLQRTLIIEVVETPVVGAIQVQNDYVLINKNSKVLQIDKQLRPDIPLILGAKTTNCELYQNVTYENEFTATILTDIFEAIEKSEIKNITSIDLTSKINYILGYENRIYINLGRITDIDYKLETCKNILNNGSIGAMEKGKLDVSLVASQNKSYFKPTY